MIDQPINQAKLSILETFYGRTKEGKSVSLFTMKNKSGVEVKFITYGASITSIRTPDKNGNFENIVLGFSNLSGYENEEGRPYLGAVVGRYANRIASGKFSLDGNLYQIPINNFPNALHGGPIGFDRKIWEAKILPEKDDQVSVRLSLESKDGDQGFPGNLLIQMIYTLTNNNELIIHYTATTDQPTVINLTNHSYFNICGEGKGSVEEHVLKLYADSYTPSDQYSIPVGEIESVEGTPMDFRVPTPIGKRIRESFQQLLLAHGYDHNWVINGKPGQNPRPAVCLYDPKSLRMLEVLTTQPGIQVYTANYLNGTCIGSSGSAYRQGDGVAFETQHFPDSPNKPQFPSTRLDPGQTFDETTIFRFSIKKD